MAQESEFYSDFVLNLFMRHFFLRSCVICLSWAGRSLLVGVIFSSLLLLTLRYWLLPDIGKFRHDIAAAITRVAGQAVYIDDISANWDGLRPHLSMHGVSVSDSDGNLVLVFPEIEGTVSWRSILRGELNFHAIAINRPALVARRDEKGYFHIAGVMLDEAYQESGFFDWLLRQRQLIVNQAIVYWQDDLRKSPVLYLESVNLRLQNDWGGKRHRFGLQAQPQGIFASRVDIRGNLAGDSIRSLSAWQGRLFIQLEEIDLGNWQKWVVLPGEQVFKHGKGDVRAWVDVSAGNFSGGIVDVGLHNTAIRFAQHLPELEIDRLYGRWGWTRTEDAQGTDEAWFAHHLRIGLRDLSLAQPAALSWQMRSPKGNVLPEHSLQASELDIDILARVIACLPVESSWHEFLSGLSPEGVVEHLRLEWRDAWSETPSFRINAGFSDLAVRAFNRYPSFNGASGIVDATEAGGSVFLASRDLGVGEVERSGEKLSFDALTGRVDWELSSDHDLTLLKFNDVAFSGSGGVGRFHGYYAFGEDMPDRIDLAGNLSQVDMVYLGQYAAWIPEGSVVERIRKAVTAGRLSDVKFHVQSKLDSRSADGLSIYLETAINNAAVRVSSDWPELSNMTGHLLMQDDVLDVSLSSADFFDIRLQDFALQTSNLYAKNPTVRIKSAAEGESEEMVALIKKIFLDPYTVGLLDQVGIVGKGRLQTDIVASVRQESFSIASMRGRYQFIDNKIDFGKYVPDLYQVNGALAFTESGVTVDGLHAQALGGPVEITSVSLPRGGMRIAASGQAYFDLLQPDILVKPVNLSQLWTGFMRGSTSWQARVDIAENQTQVIVESLLEGAESVLPEPLSKTASEIIPVRFEGYFAQLEGEEDDRIHFHYGDIVVAEFQQVREKTGDYRLVRGVISFGGNVILPQDSITRIEGTISRLEWDQWLELFRRHNGIISAPSSRTGRKLDGILTELARFDLHIGELEFLGSRFNDVVLTIDKRDKTWRMHTSSREIAGEVDWYDSPSKKVVARLSRLIVPESVLGPVTLHEYDQPVDWPIADVEADELIVEGILLGRLKLNAVQEKEGWRVRNLEISHSDGKFQANGIWQNRKPPFRMAYSNIQLQSDNIGRFLKQHGYPGRITRGEGMMGGNLKWTGKPFSIDFPSLSGNLGFSARNGQFTELKPGIGRLLGVFDLKSLPRRLMLDFYDVFGKGFGFDYFRGDIDIKDGVASADDLHIAGSAAELALSGKWNLVDETQSLNLKVFPSFGLVTPIAGIAAMIATKTLQDPFARILLNEYAITGSWSDPVVVRLDNNSSGAERPKNQPQLKTIPE